MDSGSSSNYCCTRLLRKLVFPIKPYPKPHKLQWTNDDGGNVVKEQVKYSFDSQLLLVDPIELFFPQTTSDLTMYSFTSHSVLKQVFFKLVTPG